jgi:hypothetical protein
MTKQTKTFRSYRGLTGERALVVSIMALAVDDAMELGQAEGIVDARRYFTDGLYEDHLSLLGLPAEYFPEVT